MPDDGTTASEVSVTVSSEDIFLRACSAVIFGSGRSRFVWLVIYPLPSKPSISPLSIAKTDGESIRRGAEFVLQWKDNIGDLKYGVSANFTFYDDRWNINPNESEISLKNPYKRSTQVSAYSGVYYKNLGYYKNYEDIMNSPKRNGSTNLMAGDLKYYDFNGDGKIDGDDQYRQGSGGTPRSNYGFTVDLEYKGWSLNMLWQGSFCVF